MQTYLELREVVPPSVFFARLLTKVCVWIFQVQLAECSIDPTPRLLDRSDSAAATPPARARTGGPGVFTTYLLTYLRRQKGHFELRKLRDLLIMICSLKRNRGCL